MTIPHRHLLTAVLCFTVTQTFLQADVVPFGLFQDGAVLQRDQPVPIWGQADAGEKVTVSFSGQELETTADAQGFWSVTLAPMAANSTPSTLVITGKNRVTLSDIVVGEVWLASGQSNMGWEVSKIHDADLESRTARFPLIRQIRIARAPRESPADDIEGEWLAASPATVGNFSAVAYAFAKDLHLALDVPVGIINSTWGGTPIESWMSSTALASNPAFEAVAQRWVATLADYPAKKAEYNAALAAWEEDKNRAEASGETFTVRAPRPPPGPGSQHTPSSLYNGMIAPLTRTALRGVIWYQGESNSPHAGEYQDLFAAMIRDWRNAFHQKEMPFFWAQLAGYSEDSSDALPWAVLREGQNATLSLPATGQVVVMDAGLSDSSDIHPRNKTPIGRRFARLALARVYGDTSIKDAGPIFSGIESVPADPTAEPPRPAAIRVLFRNINGQLRQPLPEVTGVEVAGEDRVFHRANAQIEDNTLVVHSDVVPTPVAVRYAWRNYAVAWLQDDLGLPVPPFRSDTW
jgi:sialate O-acetylesterase